MKKTVFIFLFILGLLLSGCATESGDPVLNIKPEERPADIEPTATYDWMAGESPVPTKRIGVFRYGLNTSCHANGPQGVYYASGNNIVYADNGSDTLVKLCGRIDCTHNTSDCNSYLDELSSLSFYHGYLYAVSGGFQADDEYCYLYRMEPDGSGRVMVYDLYGFSQDIGGDFAAVKLINDGICIFGVYRYLVDEDTEAIYSEIDEYYYYKLDGSMDSPAAMNGYVMFSCGNVFLDYHPIDAQHGGQYGSYLSWDPETNASTYLTDHPGAPGYFDEDEGYFYRDGAIWRKDYATQTEQIMVEVGASDRYALVAFPDCIVLASRAKEDRTLYVYNWAFELVGTVVLTFVDQECPSDLLVAETADCLVFTDTYSGAPKYYINKSDLGTGNAQIHEFKYA